MQAKKFNPFTPTPLSPQRPQNIPPCKRLILNHTANHNKTKSCSLNPLFNQGEHSAYTKIAWRYTIAHVFYMVDLRHFTTIVQLYQQGTFDESKKDFPSLTEKSSYQHQAFKNNLTNPLHLPKINANPHSHLRNNLRNATYEKSRFLNWFCVRLQFG